MRQIAPNAKQILAQPEAEAQTNGRASEAMLLQYLSEGLEWLSAEGQLVGIGFHWVVPLELKSNFGYA